MVPLDRVKVCGNKRCRQLLPADPGNEPEAAFHAKRREGGVGSRVLSWQSWCKDCVRQSTRVRAGIRARGKPYAQRTPGQTADERAADRKARYAREHADHVRRMAASPLYAREHRAKVREASRIKRRRAGVLPRWPNRRAEGLPAAPLSEWLAERATAQGFRAIAERAGYDEKRIRTLAAGREWNAPQQRWYPIKRVSLSVAERVVEAAGGILDDVWPDGLV